jgi:uncharacterized protein (TIGR03435 family)
VRNLFSLPWLSSALRFRSLPTHAATLCLAGVLAACAYAPINAQVPQGAPLAYDVVSVKVNHSGRGRWGIDVGDYTYRATNIPLKELIASAYGIGSDLVFGLPGPLDGARFDIDAKLVAGPTAPQKLTDRQRPGMLKAILADRFGIKAHAEVKTLPVFDLVVARSGLKIKPTAPGDSARDSGTSIHPTAVIASDITMGQLAGTLTGILHRKVIDKTGLAGNYDMDLKWTPDTLEHPLQNTDAPVDAPPTIFTAVEEQLGLKLESAKGPVETLVLDHADMPSEN